MVLNQHGRPSRGRRIAARSRGPRGPRGNRPRVRPHRSSAFTWRGPTGRTVLRIAFAGNRGERDESAASDRAILRHAVARPAEIIGPRAEHRSPLVLRCIDDYLAGIRHPLTMLQHLPTDELPRLAAAIR